MMGIQLMNYFNNSQNYYIKTIIYQKANKRLSIFFIKKKLIKNIVYASYNKNKYYNVDFQLIIIKNFFIINLYI